MITQTRILDSSGNAFHVERKVLGANLRASFDAAKTNDDNKNHWAAADGLSPNASVDPYTRKLLRNRSRYEVKNNSYLNGMVRTKAYYVVGRGPRLQMLGMDSAGKRQIESAWKTWCRHTGFCRKLRTACTALYVDGEAFALKTTNYQLAGKTPVTLDLRLYEADQIADPWWRIVDQSDERRIDGMQLDGNGNPMGYYVLRHHPGSHVFSGNNYEGTWVRAGQLIHHYREDRPGQRRGIPWITPALPLFSVMRRYTLASLHSSEWAAEMNGVMKSTAAMAPEEYQDVEDLLEIPWARNMLMTLPAGWDLQQLKAEQPTTTFGEFYRAILNEAARCLDMPFNVAAANSSDYNYASGRLDHQLFFKSTEIERTDLEDCVIEPVFEDWLREYLGASAGVSPMDVDLSMYSHVWGWDDVPHVDPQKAAAADKMYWDLGLLPDEDYLLRNNVDPEEHYEKLARMYEARRQIGAPLPSVAMQSIETPGDMMQEAPDDEDS